MRATIAVATILVARLALLSGCSTPATPSDDPADYQIDLEATYQPQLGTPRWVVPSATLPAEVTPQASNANVDIIFYEGRLYMAWRSAPSHFATPQTVMWIVSSGDGGASWRFEHQIAIGADLREPRFVVGEQRLQFYFFEAGTAPLVFQPKQIWRIERRGVADWSDREAFGAPTEVPWRFKRRKGVTYLTSYIGDAYAAGSGAESYELYFQRSDDGRAFSPADPQHPIVHQGGLSEAAFEFDNNGDLWAIGRNETGDDTGFGSKVCFAPASAIGAWDCGDQSDPERYDSPEMFRHGRDIYVVARRDIGGPYDQGLTGTLEEQRSQNLIDYSLRPKRTALYRLNRDQRRLEHLFDLPSAGDTSFPSVRRTGPHSYLIANYTSPIEMPDRSWLQGQVAAEGTQIYLIELNFVAAF